MLGILIWDCIAPLLMPKTRVSLSLPTDLVEEIDSQANAWGLNRSDFVADKISEALEPASPESPLDDDSQSEYEGLTEREVDEDDEDGEINLTEGEQAMFDAGMEYGRQEALEEIANSKASRPESHEHHLSCS